MSLLLVLVILLVLVLVHEFGHFLVAKRAGIRVLEFGFGIPPRIVGKKIGETVYSINLLPIGGFVRLFGEEAEEVKEMDLRGISKEELQRLAFFARSKKVRMAVLLAGVAMNFLFGVVVFSGLYTVIGIPEQTEQVQIVGVSRDSPASEMFVLGDVVTAVDGLSVSNPQAFQELVQARKGEVVGFTVLRNGQTVDTSGRPRVSPPEKAGPPALAFSRDPLGVGCIREVQREGPLGVVVAPKVEMVRYPFWQMPFRGAGFGLGEAYAWGANIVAGLGRVFAQVACGSAPEEVGGFVEISFMVSEVSKLGAVAILQFLAVLSVNLAVVNLLPFPPLDGGRLLFVGMEALMRRRISPRAEQITHAVGMAFLIALMVAISIQDVVRRFGTEWVWTFLEKVFPM